MAGGAQLGGGQWGAAEDDIAADGFVGLQDQAEVGVDAGGEDNVGQGDADEVVLPGGKLGDHALGVLGKRDVDGDVLGGEEAFGLGEDERIVAGPNIQTDPQGRPAGVGRGRGWPAGGRRGAARRPARRGGSANSD